MRPIIPISPIKYAFAVTIPLALALSVQGAPGRPKYVNNAALTQAFIRAVSAGNLRKMQILLSESVNPAATGENGEIALYLAADGGLTRSVNFLLDHGVSAKNKNGDEALFAAICDGHTGVVKALLRHGANANARDSDGAMPLMIACFYDTHEGVIGQSPDIVRLLLLYKADVKAKDNHGKTALMYLKNAPNARTHGMLLKAGAVK
jgi:ankyrin repeat protein